jgi:transcriptional regulator with XRE-family HTH domain
MAMEREKLTTWLAAQIEERGWTIRELGRRAGVSHTAVARAVSGESTPNADTCIGLARALGAEPEWVLRLAGRLPPLPPEVANERELISLYRSLPPDRREAALDAIRGLAGRVQPLPSPREPGEVPPALDVRLIAQGNVRPMTDEQWTATKQYFEQIWDMAPPQLKSWVGYMIAAATARVTGEEREEILPCEEDAAGLDR